MNRNQKIKAVVYIVIAVVGCIVIDILATLSDSVFALYAAIFVWVVPVIVFHIQVVDRLDLYFYYSYFLASDHESYYQCKNIFDGAVELKTKRIVKHKRFLKDKVVEPTFKVMKNPTLNLVFRVYELKDGLQLIRIRTRDNQLRYDKDTQKQAKEYNSDCERNYASLAKKYPPVVPELKEPYLEYIVSEDNRILFGIKKIDWEGYDYYVAELNIARIWFNCFHLKKEYKNLFPRFNRDFYDWHDGAFRAQTIEEAREYAHKQIEEMISIDKANKK